MTPDEIALVQQTFVAVSQPDSDVLARRFYERLFAASPDSRQLFPSELAEQRTKFIDALDAIVWSIANLDEFLQTTMGLGARHVAYGATAEHYHAVGEALLGALADELGTTYTPDVGAAWAAAYDLVAETMMLGASQAAARP